MIRPPLRATFAAVLCAMIAGVAAAAPRKEPPDRASLDMTAAYQHAIEAIQTGRYGEALTALAPIADALPEDASVQLALGLAHAGAGDDRAAERAFAATLALDDELILPRQERARALVRLGETDEARVELERLRARAAACADACPQAEDLTLAIAAVEQALTPENEARLTLPMDRFARVEDGERAYLRAAALINEERFDAALHQLRTAARIYGPDPDVLAYQGFAHRKRDRFDRAERYYQAALTVAPGHRRALEYYGELQVERGDLAGAEALLARLEAACTFGCAEADELRRWIEDARS